MGAYAAFADLLSYPGPEVLAVVDRCMAGRLAPEHLLAFRAEAERLGVSGLEEAYTAAFDLDPACSLYVGHHVFGENARRSVFMVRLAELYRASGLPQCDRELPDHLPVVLRYLDAAAPCPQADDLLRDALVPALGRLVDRLEPAHHPYTPVLRALLALMAPALADAGRQGAPA